jgi:hypothetical protein
MANKVIGLALVATHVCDEECQKKPEGAKADGPAKVNTPEYIREYQRIFGGKTAAAKA